MTGLIYCKGTTEPSAVKAGALRVAAKISNPPLSGRIFTASLALNGWILPWREAKN